jgi:DNA uptake protein ComE-like DNA-binding protein
MIRRSSLLPAALAALALTACSGAKDAPADSAAVAGDTIAPAAASPTATAPADSAAAAMPAPADGALLDPDAATRDQLAAVPGMTPGAADALVAGRPYADMRAVDKVLTTAQLDSATRRTVYARVFKPIDLNKASDEEIVLIPGVGNRMRREFKEYRPYKDMARFRREIGKYVDSTEVARLEKYVTIK